MPHFNSIKINKNKIFDPSTESVFQAYSQPNKENKSADQFQNIFHNLQQTKDDLKILNINVDNVDSSDNIRNNKNLVNLNDYKTVNQTASKITENKEEILKMKKNIKEIMNELNSLRLKNKIV